MDYTNDLAVIQSQLQSANNRLTNIENYISQNIQNNQNREYQLLEINLQNASGDRYIQQLATNIQYQNTISGALLIIMTTALLYNFIVRCFK